MNISSVYILNKYIIIDDKDPPWMMKAIKKLEISIRKK